ncbi:MAG: glycosyltransferase family 39 protein [Conexibacteraceae bacterium]|nr:glycosyltransferase family 39 protein [Conexibacteraceae bacterium]
MPVVALTVLAAALRFYGLGHQGFWYDEASTALLVKFSPGQMLGLIPQTESTPPLYYCVAWVWSRLFGDTEAGLRSLSALVGVLVVPVAYFAAKKLLASRRAALITAALTACNPLLIWYSQEARAYSLLVLLCALATLAFAYARATPDPRLLGAWALASILALLTHYYAVVAVAPQAAWLLYEHRRRRSVQLAIASVVVCGLALIPLVVAQSNTGHDAWIARSSLHLRLAQILPQFLIGTGAPIRMVLKYAAFALALVGLWLLAFRTGRRERWPALLAAGLAVSGFVLSLVFVASGNDTLITRNILALWLPCAIAIAGGLGAARARWLGPAVAAALCGIGLTAAIGVAADYDLQRPNWRPVAAALGPWPAIGAAGAKHEASRVVLVQRYLDRLPLALYMPGLSFPKGNSMARVAEVDVISMHSPGQPLCWWGAACNLITSRAQADYPIPGFREVSRRRIEQFTITTMRAANPVRVTRADLASALTTTRLSHDIFLVQR